MEELYINNILVELPDNSVSQTFQINDIGELKDRQANYSNNIKIPKTPKNVATFEMLGVAGNGTRIPYENVSVKYVVNGIELIANGKGVVKNTNNYYNLVVYDGNIDMLDLLGSKEIRTLDFSAYNHTLTNDVFLNSFTNTSGYIYGLGSFYNGDNLAIQTTSLKSPSFFVSTLFEMIFTQEGYTITGDIFTNADFLTRVTSVNNGYIRTINDNLSSVYSRDNSTDPVVNETFVSSTLKEYVIDSYTAASSGTFNINLQGSIALTNYTPDAFMLIKVNGDIVYQIAIDGAVNIVEDVLASSGENIDIVLLMQSISVSSVETITFETNYTTFISLNDMNVDVNFNLLFGDIQRKDFIKDIVQRFCLMYRKVRNKNEFEFKQMKSLLNEKSLAENWSDKYSSFKNESYNSSYGQTNYMKYNYDSNDSNIVETFGDGKMLVDNSNLQVDKTLFTSLFKASSNRNGFYNLFHWNLIDDAKEPNNDGLRIFKINLLSDSINYRFKETINNSATYTGSIAYLNFDSINYQNEIDNYYKDFNWLLNDYKMINLTLNLSLIDIYNLDFFKLKYFNQLGKYYYLNKIKKFKNNKTVTAELIEIGKKVVNPLLLTSAYSGSSTYASTLTKLESGYLVSSYNGSSSYISTLRKSTLTAFDMSNTGISEVNVCAETPTTTYYHNGSSSTPSVSDTVYSDATGTTVVNGGSLFFKIIVNQYIQINSVGEVISKSVCGI